MAEKKEEKAKGNDAITVHKTVFRSMLDKISGIVSSRNSFEILNCIKLEFQPGKMAVHVTDLEMWTFTEAPCEANDVQTAVVDGKALIEIVRLLAKDKQVGDNIELAIDPDHLLRLSCESFSCVMPLLKAEDYPQPKNLLAPEGYQSLPLTEFQEAFKKVSFCASIDSSSPLGGVAISRGEKGLRLMATDGSILAIEKLTGNNKKEEEKVVIVPIKALKVIQKMQGDEIRMFIEEKKDKLPSIGLYAPNIGLTSSLIEGIFPPVDTIIPESFLMEVSFNRQEMIKAVMQARIASPQFSGLCRFNFERTKCTLATASESGEAEIEVACNFQGEQDSFLIAFNVKYILKSLRAFDSEEVMWQFNDAKTISLFKPVNGSECLQLLMPLEIDFAESNGKLQEEAEKEPEPAMTGE